MADQFDSKPSQLDQHDQPNEPEKKVFEVKEEPLREVSKEEFDRHPGPVIQVVPVNHSLGFQALFPRILYDILCLTAIVNFVSKLLRNERVYVFGDFIEYLVYCIEKDCSYEEDTSMKMYLEDGHEIPKIVNLVIPNNLFDDNNNTIIRGMEEDPLTLSECELSNNEKKISEYENSHKQANQWDIIRRNVRITKPFEIQFKVYFNIPTRDFVNFQEIFDIDTLRYNSKYGFEISNKHSYENVFEVERQKRSVISTILNRKKEIRIITNYISNSDEYRYPRLLLSMKIVEYMRNGYIIEGISKFIVPYKCEQKEEDELTCVVCHDNKSKNTDDAVQLKCCPQTASKTIMCFNCVEIFLFIAMEKSASFKCPWCRLNHNISSYIYG